MKCLALLAIALAAGADAAAAQTVTREQMIAVRNACQADIKRVCAGIQPGGGRLLQCIKANPEQISQPCKDVLISVRAAQQK